MTDSSMNIKDLMRKDIDIIMLGEDKTQRETDKDEAVPINGANIYLSLDVLFSDSHINPIEGVKFRCLRDKSQYGSSLL